MIDPEVSFATGVSDCDRVKKQLHSVLNNNKMD